MRTLLGVIILLMCFPLSASNAAYFTEIVDEPVSETCTNETLEEYVNNLESTSTLSTQSTQVTVGECLDRLWEKVKGYRYCSGGNGNGSFDCSGFVIQAMRSCLGWTISDTTAAGLEGDLRDDPRCKRVSINYPQVGDICFEGVPPTHTFIISGTNPTEIMHARNSECDMRREPLPDWRKKLVSSCYRCTK